MFIIKCINCGNHIASTCKYCSECGTLLPSHSVKKYSGVRKELGIYSIIFQPVEGLFSTMAGAIEAARHSCWHEDLGMNGFTIRRTVSKCTIDTHPYICNACKDSVVKEDGIVGNCQLCGKIDWVLRDGTEDEGCKFYVSLA